MVWYSIKFLFRVIGMLFLNLFYYLRFYLCKRKFKNVNNESEKVGWELTFQDEFDSDNINFVHWNKWFSERPMGGPSVNGATNSLDCLTLKDGYLYMTTNKNDDTSSPYPCKTGILFSGYDEYCESGSGESKIKGWKQQYGYYETRCKPPIGGKKFWPAFWLWNQWPPEIDIFEFLSEKDYDKNYTKRITMTQHWGTPGKKDMRGASQIGRKLKGIDWSEDFHTYAIRWEWNYVEWYIDNIAVFRNVFNVPNNDMSIQIGNGAWAKNPPKDEDMPADLIVDYVRAYKKIR